MKVGFHKDCLVFLVSSKPEPRKISREVSDPVCLLKIIRTLPHFAPQRYSVKMNGDWMQVASLDSNELDEKSLRKIEALKFLPTNEIIWTTNGRVVDFTPF